MIEYTLTITDDGKTGGPRALCTNHDTATDREKRIAAAMIVLIGDFSENIPGTKMESSTLTVKDSEEK